MVVLALYALTPAFYYIPDATLAAVVIHAVSDLVSGPSYVKRLAKVSLWELLVFLVAVVVTFFTTVDYGIYGSVALSAVILLFRIARPRVAALGRIQLTKQQVPQEPEEKVLSSSSPSEHLYVPTNHPTLGKWVESLPRGIIMFRVDESMTYPNSGFLADRIIRHCKEHTRRAGRIPTKAERAWNDDASPQRDAERASLPRLHAIILDFSGVNRLDSSGLQAIVDVQNTLNRYADQHVEFHFVNVPNPSVRRSLIVAGFGTQPRSIHVDDASTSGDHQQQQLTGPTEILPVVPSSRDGPQHELEESIRRQQKHQKQLDDLESLGGSTDKDEKLHGAVITLPKDKYPIFHWSADHAVQSALESLAHRPEEPDYDSQQQE